jgi:predicted ATPase/DNA-binding XRE family transcriptional regulator
VAGDGDFGSLLRRYRRRAGLSQEELAARAYVSTRAISDLERGINVRPRRHTAVALADGLGLDGEERSAFERVARADPGSERDEIAAIPPRARPPLTVDSFIDDGDRVTALLEVVADRRNRVITLTGPGGIGKSRLALEVAARLDGAVAFVSLAALDDPGLLAAVVGDALGVDHGPTRTHLQSLIEHVDAQRLTLVLDNVEQLVDAAADIVAMVQSCPGLTVVTTSRVPLRVAGEVCFAVGPLSTRGDAESRPDVRLFLERVASAGAAASDGLDDVAAVGELCAWLDGVPLAIELAAARAGIVPPAEMLRHLDRALDLLSGAGAGRPTQHRSMRAALEWSFRLLPAAAQEAFSALGVFAASASTDAVLAVWGVPPSSMPTFFDLVQVLADAHLVTVDRSAPTGVRIDLYETTRQFAREKLDASPLAAVVLERLQGWALDLVERGEIGLMGADQLAWLDQLDRDLPNLRGLVRRLTDVGGETANEVSMRLAAGLQRFWEIRTRLSEGAAWLRDTLDRPGGADGDRAKAHKALGVMYRCLGEPDRADVEHVQAVQLYRRAGDDIGAAACLNNRGVVALDLADWAQAADLFRQGLEILEALGEDQRRALILNNLGLVTIETGDLRAAVRLCRQSRDLLAAHGNVASQCWADDNLASALTMAGHPTWAVPIHERTVRQRLRLGDENGFVWSLEGLAAAWTGVGEVERAGLALGFVAAHRQRLGTILVPHLNVLSARRREALVARIGAERADALWEQGADLEPAVVHAWFAD